MSFRVLMMISKNDRYGAQRIFLDQAASLHALGHSVTVVVRGNEGYVTDSVRAMGLVCHGIPMKGLKDVMFLRRLILDDKIDIIHTTLDRADHFGVIVSRLTKRPVVSTMMVPRCHIGFRFMRRVITLANKQASLLRDYGIPRDRIIVVRPGIDVERFSRPDSLKSETWKKNLQTAKRSMIFCHIASMQERKAHMVSLELTSECKKRGENPLLVIIGDPLRGEYYDRLLEKIGQLDIREHVYFTGWTSDIPEILSLSHFTLLPSENEALGVVLMEGMAAGTPIIARTGEGGAGLIEEYGTGLLYNPEEDVRDLAQDVIDIKRDASRYSAISEQCRKVAHEEFSLKRFGERLIEVYRNVL